MDIYKQVEEELELDIRRGFSSDLEKFKALKGWLDGAFKQMVSHHQGSMYSFRSRVKQVESLLLKLDVKIENEGNDSNWGTLKSYESLVNEVDDLIGGRLISYFIEDLPKLHDYLVCFERFFITEVTIHDMKDNLSLVRPILQAVNIINDDMHAIEDKLHDGQSSVLFNVKCKSEHEHNDKHIIPYNIRLNTNGYVGVHMVIKPMACDDYWEHNPGLFGKFELQVRSLIHEAWAEIQHEVIYKNRRMSESVKKARSSQMEGISTILGACEKSLYKAAQKSNKAIKSDT